MCAVRQNSIYLKSPPFASAPRRKRIAAAAELDSQRRSLQLELLAKPAFQVSPVGLRHMLERVAVNYDQRRVGPTLVRIAQLGPKIAGTRRILTFDRSTQRTGQ